MKIAYLIILGLLGLGCFGLNKHTFTKSCLTPEPSDSKSFGHTFAIHGNHIAIGDPEANRVVLYHRQVDGKWSRVREIIPPKGSPAAKVGSGFGYDLALDNTVLVIGAYTVQRKPSSQDGFQWTNQLGVSFSGGIYQAEIHKDTVAQRLDVPVKGEISGFSVSVDKGKIAFGITKEDQPDQWNGAVGLWINGHLERITPPTQDAARNFGRDLELKQNLLLVGAPSDGTGAAWLFDLNGLNRTPRRLAIPGISLGRSVALSDKFVAVGTPGGGGRAGPPPKTMIMSLIDGSTAVLDGAGDLSLADNLLARVHPTSPDNEQRAQLELFDLKNLSNPRLVDKRGGVSRAQLTDNYLVSMKEIYAQDTYANGSLCIEPHHP